MSNHGLLLTITEPPPAMDEEFNAWYDTEHLAERLAITGFRSARRWVANYLARTSVFRRWACEQREPGCAEPHPLAKAVLPMAQDAPFETPCIPGALQARRFVAHPGTPAHIALIEVARLEPTRVPSAQPGALLRLYRAYGA